MNASTFLIEKGIRLVLLPFLLAVFPTMAHGQEQAETPSRCRLFVANGLYAPEGPPKLRGDVFRVSELRFRFPGEKSSSVPERVDIFYVWRWFEYPTSGATRAVWSEANDIVECQPDGSGELLVPAFAVEPKGWYSGKFAGEKGLNLPRFDHVEVSFVTKECGTPRLTFRRKELEKFSRMIAKISLPCGELARLTFVAK